MISSSEKLKIIEKSKEIGIDKIGFTTADPFLALKKRLKDQQVLGYQSGFEKGTIAERTTPRLLLKDAHSIISIAVGYPSKLKNPPKSVKGDRRGIFSRASWGNDYHSILRDKLKKLEHYLEETFPNERFASMVDTGELSDRAVAERSGIGWSAKNCAVISPELGSYMYLGEMITTLSIEPDSAILDQCGTCNKCVEACPTGALVQGGQLDSNKCIAFLTQTKTMLPKQFRKKIGNRLYGCDTCQVVCPKNKGINNDHHRETVPDPEKVKPRLLPILSLSNREFKEEYGAMSGSWRGKNPIQRNAIIALGFYKEEKALPKLLEMTQNDPRPVIRGTAAWSIGEITDDLRVIQALENNLETEEDHEVREEIKQAIERMQEKRM